MFALSHKLQKSTSKLVAEMWENAENVPRIWILLQKHFCFLLDFCNK